MIDQPRQSLDVLRNRVQQFDANTARALITNNRYISDEHIDRVMQSIEDAKKFLEDKLHSMDHKVRQSVKNMQRKAVIKAENTRKLAAVAAWWLVASAVLSAGAAVLATTIFL